MINRHELTKEQALYAVNNGEFGPDVLGYPNVIVVMTQDWCSQWKSMKNWLYELDIKDDFEVFEVEYNRTGFYTEFMRFKENKFENDQVPYLRFYKDGSLVKESNYMSMQTLQGILECY